MKYKDLFPMPKGLFLTVFKQEFPEEYAELFDTLNPSVLDAHALYHYGDKKLNLKITENDNDEYIKSIIVININIWIERKRLLSLDYDLLKPINEVTSKTGTVNVDGNNNNTNTNAIKAFNDNGFKENERTQTDGETTKKEEYNVTNTKSGSNNNFDVTARIEKEIAFRRQSFLRSVIKDIADELTLKVY